jgi:PAS domain S-box-containing protein
MIQPDPLHLLEQIRKLRHSAFSPEEVQAFLSDAELWLTNHQNTASQPEKQDVAELDPLDDNRFFLHLVEDAAIGIGVFSEQKVLFANSKLMEMFRYSGRTPQSVKYSDFFCDRASSRTLSIMQQREKMFLQGVEITEPFIGEFTREDKKKMFLEVHSKPYNTKTGLWRICFMLDVTEKLETRIELDQRMHRYESIINGTDAGTWEWNFRDQKGVYNEKWANMIGYELSEIIKLGPDLWVIFAHPDDAEMVTAKTIDLIAGKTDILQFEARLKHKDGHWVWIHSRGRITDWTEDGQPLMLSGSNIDISDRKLADEKLLLAKEELERSVQALSIASHAKEDFLSTMSHEIRTPLNAVIGLTNLLLRRNPRPDQLEIVKTLKLSSDNLLHLVNDILDYNKIQAGKLQLESVRFNFRELLEHMYAMYKLDAHDKGIGLSVKADSEIPDILEGDVTRLNQILTNLLGNALKFTKEGKVTLSASLVDAKDGYCTIRFVVTDTGIGIHPSRLKSVFEPFHQSDASISRQFGGTGLGLSIINSLVKMFKGTIDVTSVPGVGSSFSVELKLRETSLASIDQWAARWELPSESRHLEVLYVEDVESNRFLVKSIMEEFQLSCTIAANGLEALEKTSAKKFDIILMDIQMPDMNGYQVVELITTQADGKNRSTPVIAFTAEPITENLRVRLRRHRMVDVISKPFDIDQFMEKMSSFAKTVPDDPEYSFSFYERINGGGNLPILVADEIKSFSAALLKAYNNHDLESIRSEIHKLHPILKNLSMLRTLDLLEALRTYPQIEPSMLDLILTVNKRIAAVAEDLLLRQALQSKL